MAGVFLGILRTGTIAEVRAALGGIDASVTDAIEFPQTDGYTPPAAPPPPPPPPPGTSLDGGYTGPSTFGRVTVHYVDGAPVFAETNSGPYRRASVPSLFWDALRTEWPMSHWPAAVALAFLESDYITTAKNPSPLEDSWGYFQVNRNAWPDWTPEQLVDPVTNARVAYMIYQAQGWPAWYHSATALGLI